MCLEACSYFMKLDEEMQRIFSLPLPPRSPGVSSSVCGKAARPRGKNSVFFLSISTSGVWH